MTDNVVHPMKFRKHQVVAVEEVLRDIAVDLDEVGPEAAKAAEMIAVMRRADGSLVMWSSKTLSTMTTVGGLEMLKHHLLSLHAMDWRDEPL